MREDEVLEIKNHGGREETIGGEVKAENNGRNRCIHGHGGGGI